MVLDEETQSLVQSVEGRIVRRQHQRIRGQVLQKMLVRSQPLPQRITFGFTGTDTDIGGNTGDHLVARNKDVQGRTVQTGVFRRMSPPAR